MYRIDCPRCGTYKISWECIMQTATEEDTFLLSGLSRELLSENKKGTEAEFLTTNIKELKASYPVPNPEDLEARARKFLSRIRNRTEYFGQKTIITYRDDFPLAYAKNVDEFIALLGYLSQRKYIDWTSRGDGTAIIALTANGWGVIGDLKKDKEILNQGFIAAWFDASMEASIKAAEEAVTESGFEAVCIKNKLFSDKVMDKALSEIRKSKFVIANLTGTRSSVFFEAGFAFGLNKDIIFVYDEKGGLPPEFYAKHYQCYAYKDEIELKDILKNAIAARIKK